MAYPTYTDSNGFVRFESNDNIPFADYLEENHPHVDIEAHDEQRQIENAAFINEYIKAQANRSEDQIREERMEARAAFGPGETVVNVFSGERYTT